MAPCVYQLACAVCVLMSCLSQTAADFTTQRAKVSEACSKTLDKCIQQSGSSTPSSDVGWCILLGATVNGVSAYQCAVRIGFCTEMEFLDLKYEACVHIDPPSESTSALKTSVYNQVKSTSSACQSKIIDCIFGSSVAIVLKQQEQYCQLINLRLTSKTTTLCLKDECLDTEIASLYTIACSTNQSQSFSDAIMATSQQCQDGFESYTYGVTEVLARIKTEKYCQVLSPSLTTTPYDALLLAGCTESEFLNLKTAACGGSRVIVVSVILLALATLYHVI